MATLDHGGLGPLTRRRFTALVGTVGAALGVPRSGSAAPAVVADAIEFVGPSDHALVIVVNGERRTFASEPRVTLLDALRDRLELTGSKKGCDHGQCGACTVLVDGRRVNACLTLAASAQGKSVTTIEGLARGEQLHPMQAAFLAHDGFQCGYCTPGQIVSAVGLVAERRALDDDSVREQMSGNICRCGAYTNIVAAVQDAARSMA